MSPKIQRVLVMLVDSGRKLPQLLDNVSIANQRKMLLRRSSSAKSVESLSARDFRVFEFDAVGYEYELHMRGEITQLMDEVFRFKMHSSLMHFSPFKLHNLNFLTRVLVAEVDKMMLALRCRIKSIKLEYYDVRKFDMVNMLERQRWPTRRQTNQSNNLTVQSTRELFKWLLSDYKLLRSRSMGDEYINVQFEYIDGSLKEQRVQLTIFQISNCSKRTDLLKFFSLLPIGKKTNITMMTDCIKDSFDLNEPTLLMFELPTSEDQLKLMSKMLQLAHTAYVNIDTLNNQTNQMTKENQMFHDIKERALALGSDTKEPPSVSSLLSTRVNKTNLSYWYRCINDAFANVTASMTEFYSTSSQNKLLRMCRELCSLEDYEAEHNESSEVPALGGKVQELAARRKYLHYLANFRKLYDEVKQTVDASTLEVYISAKNYELIKAEKLIKQQGINYLRQGITNFIKLEPIW